MSNPADNPADPPRRRVPKDPFSNLPPATPRAVPAQPRESPPQKPAQPVRPAPARRENPPPSSPPPSTALVRVEDPDRPRRDVEDVRPRRRVEPLENEPEPPRSRKRAPDPPEEFEEPRRPAPRSRRRDPDDEPLDDPPPRSRRRDPFEEDEEAASRPSHRVDTRERNYPEDPEPPSREGRRTRDYPPGKAGTMFQKILKWLRFILDFSNVAYFVALVLILVTLETEGEGSLYIAPLLYLPAVGWLVPVLVLAFFSLILWRPWWLLLHTGCVAGVLLVFMHYQFNNPREPHGASVAILSNNIGESHGKSFAPFAESEKVDLIALQDAGGRGPDFGRRYTNHYVAAAGQFVLISRLPIKKADIIPLSGLDNVAVAACFEVEWQGRALAIYNIHMPTARRELEALKGLGGLATLFGKEGGHGSKVREDSAQFWSHQVGLARGLAGHILQDKRPVIICGDLNAPDHGIIYGLFTKHFTDAHRERGRGYAYSFPADGPFPPWLRIDHIMSSSRMVPVYSVTEPNRKSQHRSVVARFEYQ